ncbi:amino acid synthesis family protein (plasmid) [Mesorhizobium sp. ORM8.1]
MIDINIRKIQTIVECTYHDGGPSREEPRRRAAALAVVKNPFAGKFESDLIPFMEALKPLGKRLAREAIEAIGLPKDEIDLYGKGSIVGVGGELEHAVLWHSPGGAGLRAALGGGTAFVPGCQKMGAAGATLDLPLGNIDDQYVRSHYDAISVMISDAPRPDEIVLIVAYASGARVHARLGGQPPNRQRQRDRGLATS